MFKKIIFKARAISWLVAIFDALPSPDPVGKLHPLVCKVCTTLSRSNDSNRIGKKVDGAQLWQV
jgi:hypothetical protein